MPDAGVVDVSMPSPSAKPLRHTPGARRFPVFQNAAVQGVRGVAGRARE